MSEPVRIEPLVAWPREAEAGRSYLMTVDLRLTAGSHWHYDAEEYAVLCVVSTGPSCTVGPVGEPAVLLHRFGGTYGPAQFLLTAREHAKDARLRLTLVNQAGVPIANVPLAMRIVDEAQAAPAPTVRVEQARAAAADRPAGVAELINAIDSAIAAFETQGIVLVSGEPAWRRTALARVLTERSGLPAVFGTGRELTPDAILPPLLTQFTTAPATGAAALLDQLGAIAERRSALVCAVIDGLPERSFDALWDLLARRAPRGTVFVLSGPKRRGAEVVDVGVAPEAIEANRRGMRLHGRDPVGAEQAWERAAELGHPAGANNLGILLRDRGDLDGAEAAWREAVRLGHPAGANNLGILLRDRGDLDGAEAAWRSASELGHPAGANNLGILLLRRSDRDGALAAWRRAAELGHPAAPENFAALERAREAFTPRPGPVHRVPDDPPERFVDRRREQAMLRNFIRAGDDVEVFGPPGRGKTRLVLHVLRDATLAPQDGVIYARAGGRTLDDLVGELFGALFETTRAPSASEQRAALRDRRMLVVLDDFDGSHADFERLREWLPAAQFVLVGRDVPFTGSGARIEVAPLWSEPLGAARSLDELLEQAVRDLARATGTDYNQVFLTGEERGERVLACVADAIPPHKRRYRLAAFDGVIGAALRSGEPVNVPDVREHRGYISAVGETRSELAVPIVTDDGAVVGVLNSESEISLWFLPFRQEAVAALAQALGRLLLAHRWEPELPLDRLPWLSVRSDHPA